MSAAKHTTEMIRIVPATGGGGAVASVDGRTGVVTLGDLYVDTTGDTMTGTLNVGALSGATPPIELGTNARASLAAARNASHWFALGDGAYTNPFASTNASSEVIGIYARPVLTHTAPLTGVHAGAYTSSGGSPLRGLRAVTVFEPTIATTRQAAYGVTIESPVTNANSIVTTAAGVRIEAQKSLGVVTAFGVQQVGANDLNSFAGPLAQGAVPATTGAIRLSNLGTIYSRNAANTADIKHIECIDGELTLAAASANQIRVSFGGTTRYTLTTNALQLVDGVDFSLGLSSGSRLPASATQKLGFWGTTPVVRNAGWSVTAGYTASRAFNPETATLPDVARVLGTLVDQLKSYGLVGA
jgi:hypothetical protein